jgi:hypothetical protein
MSKWRPEGWLNPYTIPIYSNKILTEIEIKAVYNSQRGEPGAFEAGADAILEALRQRGFHVDNDASFTSLGEHATLSNKGNTGDYIFIPDDEVQP